MHRQRHDVLEKMLVCFDTMALLLLLSSSYTLCVCVGGEEEKEGGGLVRTHVLCLRLISATSTHQQLQNDNIDDCCCALLGRFRKTQTTQPTLSPRRC